MEMDAGMETCRVRRSAASAKGRTTMVPRARETRTFSARAAGLVNRVVPLKLETCRSLLVARAALITGLSAARLDNPQAAAEPRRRFREESWCHAFWDALQELAPLGFGLRRHRVDLQATLFHGFDGRVAFSAAFDLHLLTGLDGSFAHRFLLDGSERVPGFFGDDCGTDKGNVIQLQKVLGGQIELTSQA